MNWIP